MLRYTLIILMFFCQSSQSLIASDTIVVPVNQYLTDINLKLIITNVDVDQINTNSSEAFSHIRLDDTWELANSVESLEVGTAYEVNHSTLGSSTLYFTEFPLIDITTSHSIVDEYDVDAYFRLIESDGTEIESNMGIQYRGGWSQTLPKKSLDLEFWTDENGTDKQDFAVLGMREDDDWNLQAMYNEPLRIRSKTNFALWQMINNLHYQEEEPDASNTVQLQYSEVFINDAYQGIYAVGEKMDRKQLKLKKHNGAIRGELYKGYTWGASTFGTLPGFSNSSETWGGFEYKHPSEEIDWNNLFDFVDFVINSDDEDFYLEYQDHFQVDNLVDYYIFLNVLRALDNTGKNIYIAKYDEGDKYFYVPWDLDGTFGIIWNGSNDAKTTDLVLNNGLFERLVMEPCLPGGFRELLKTRWTELRLSVLSDDSLMAMLNDNHSSMIDNGAYEREALVWTDYQYDAGDLTYMMNWIEDRTAHLDIAIGGECIVISDTMDVADKTMVSIFPNPAEDMIIVSSGTESEGVLMLYNQYGQLIRSMEVTQYPTTISLENLSKGIYIVSLLTNDEVHSQRIVKQ